MAVKRRLGKILKFPVPAAERAPAPSPLAIAADKAPRASRARARAAPGQLDRISGEMIEAEQALFVALRLAQGKPNLGRQPQIQPPPRTSSSRKKTAA